MVGESRESYRNLGIERSDLLRNSRWFFAHTTDGFLSGRSTSSNEKWARVPLCVVRHSTIHLWIIRCLLTENSWSNASMIGSTIINNYSGVNNFLATAERTLYLVHVQHKRNVMPRCSRWRRSVMSLRDRNTKIVRSKKGTDIFTGPWFQMERQIIQRQKDRWQEKQREVGAGREANGAYRTYVTVRFIKVVSG